MDTENVNVNASTIELLMKGKWQDSDVKLSKNALKMISFLVQTYVEEAVVRTVMIAKEEDEALVDVNHVRLQSLFYPPWQSAFFCDGWLDGSSQLEKVLPQLLLDF